MPRSLEARGPRAGASLGDSVVEGGPSSQGHALSTHPRGDPAHLQQPNLGVPEGSLAGFWGVPRKGLRTGLRGRFFVEIDVRGGPRRSRGVPWGRVRPTSPGKPGRTSPARLPSATQVEGGRSSQGRARSPHPRGDPAQLQPPEYLKAVWRDFSFVAKWPSTGSAGPICRANSRVGRAPAI